MKSSLSCALVLLAVATAAVADQWLVYHGGGIASIEGGWSEKRGQVLFTNRSGVLVSVAAQDVDLAASSFITWQLDGRRRTPPRASVTDSAASSEAEPPCVAAKLLRLVSSETMEVATVRGPEIVHLACLDAPEAAHQQKELSWFGRVSLAAMQVEAEKGAEICITEHTPPRKDAEGHRIVYVTLAGGRDYAAAAISAGFGLLRPGLCNRAASYRQLEDRAIADQRGLWSARAEGPALAAVGHSVTLDSGVSSALPPRRRAGGG